MKKNIRNYDKQGKRHGLQIIYNTNGNIDLVRNYHHGKAHGYLGLFNSDKTIYVKKYLDMSKWLYSEHHDNKQITIKV